MKIYHKFLLYQNKWIHPYTRIILGGVTYIAYLASILLIMGVVYEHGFTISEHEASQLQTLYRFVWGVFLSEVTLRLLLEYRDTKRTFKKLTWILIALLYLTLIPVIFHRPEEEGAILHFWEILNGKPYHIVLLLIFSFLNLSNGLVRVLGRRTNPSLILAGSFLIIILIGTGLLMLPLMYGERYFVGGLAVYLYQCGLCHGFDFGGCSVYFYYARFCGDYPADTDWRPRGNDTDQFLCDVLYGEYILL